jgi:hypothetical protein
LRDLILLHRVDFWKYSGIDADIGRDWTPNLLEPLECYESMLSISMQVSN